VPARAPRDLELGPKVSGMRHMGRGASAVSPEAYVPTAVDLRYTSRKGSIRLPAPGWVLEAHEAEALREPPRASPTPLMTIVTGYN